MVSSHNPMRTALYGARPDLQTVAHTHSPGLTAFASPHRPLPCRYEALLRSDQAEVVPVAHWAPRQNPISDRVAQCLPTDRGIERMTGWIR
ncbi:MAG: class II aldolase/adducin family protein [Pseudonocardiaceae bacterium]